MAQSSGCYTVDSVNIMRSCAIKSGKNYSKNVKEGLLGHMVYKHLMWFYRNLRTPQKKRMPQIAHSKEEKPWSGKIHKWGVLPNA